MPTLADDVTGVWVTASLFKCPGLFSVFWLILMLLSGWSELVLISKSSSNFTNPLVIILSASTTIGIIITFMFYSFFNSEARSRYLFLFSLSFNFTQWSARMAKSTIQQVRFFFFWLSLGLVFWPSLSDPFVSQNPRELNASHSLGQIPCCAYTTCLDGQI